MGCFLYTGFFDYGAHALHRAVRFCVIRFALTFYLYCKTTTYSELFLECFVFDKMVLSALRASSSFWELQGPSVLAVGRSHLSRVRFNVDNPSDHTVDDRSAAPTTPAPSPSIPDTVCYILLLDFRPSWPLICRRISCQAILILQQTTFDCAILI